MGAAGKRQGLTLRVTLKSPEFAKAMEDQGAFVVASSPKGVTERMQSDSSALVKTIKSGQMKVEE